MPQLTSTAQKSANNKRASEPACEYCGDPVTAQCKTKHREWILVLPGEIQKGDTILRPMNGRMYYAVSIVPSPDPNPWDKEALQFKIRTAQKVEFTIHCPDLPVLVKRDVPCGWPRCDLHCARCMRIAEEHPLERQKMQDERTLPEKKRRRKLSEDPYTAESAVITRRHRARRTTIRSGIRFAE